MNDSYEDRGKLFSLRLYTSHYLMKECLFSHIICFHSISLFGTQIIKKWKYQKNYLFTNYNRGTYGSATEDYLKDGSTPINGLVLAGDGIFPGIGIPAVALNGASAANSFVDPLTQWKCLQSLRRKKLIWNWKEIKIKK